MPKGDRLSEKQQRFVEAYCGEAQGNAAEAARIAGYSHPDKQGSRLLGNVGIAEAVRNLTLSVRSDAIATVEEVKSILTAIARDPLAEHRDKIAASDKLLKASGTYLERREVEHKGAEVRIYLPDNGRDRAD